jgi:chemotaxis protein CheD
MVVETTIRNEQAISIGMAEMVVNKNPSAPLACLGLGSCIAVCCFDPVAKIGGMVHVVLPNSEGKDGVQPTKYADRAVPLLIEEIRKLGGMKSRIVAKLVGGAQLTVAPGLNDMFKTGERNLEETEKALQAAGIRIVATDVGGSKGRTVYMYLDNGVVEVKIAGGISQVL